MIFRKSIAKHVNKRGSYILEASVCLPIFMIGIIIMSSVILMYAVIEDANFIIGTEMRMVSLEAIALEDEVLFPVRTAERIKENNSLIAGYLITDYVYRESRSDIDELIALTITINLESQNPLSINAEASYDVALVSRAYVGRERDVSPMSADEIMTGSSEIVYVFPLYGEKYHNDSCTYIKAAYTATPLTESIKSAYDSCPICESGSALIGSTVYIFPSYGGSYHLAGCSTLVRKYIELDKETAIERGYEACEKCGG